MNDHPLIPLTPEEPLDEQSVAALARRRGTSMASAHSIAERVRTHRSWQDLLGSIDWFERRGASDIAHRVVLGTVAAHLAQNAAFTPLVQLVDPPWLSNAEWADLRAESDAARVGAEANRGKLSSDLTDRAAELVYSPAACEQLSLLLDGNVQPATGTFAMYRHGTSNPLHVDNPGSGELTALYCLARNKRPEAPGAWLPSNEFVYVDGAELRYVPGFEPLAALVIDGCHVVHGRTPLTHGEDATILVASYTFSPNTTMRAATLRQS